MPTGSARAGSPSAFTAMAMRILRMVSATRPSSRSVPASKGGSVQIGATISPQVHHLLAVEVHATGRSELLPAGEVLRERLPYSLESSAHRTADLVFSA